MKLDKSMLNLARKQFLLDCNIEEEEHKKVSIGRSKVISGARIYEGKDLFFKAILSLGKAYIMVDDAIYDWAVQSFEKAEPEWFCYYGNLRKIDEKLKEYGREILDTHLYFLPSDTMEKAEINRNVRWFEQEELLALKDNTVFHNALCFSKTQPDALAVAAFEEDKMIAMAGASMDGAYLWQIGIDVLPEYEGQGLAATLTTRIKNEIIRRGKVPFYGTAESHTISQTVALKAGFLPAWAEIYTRKIP